MTESLRHRGPDDEGIYVDRRLGLGHRRLSIVDLSPRGHQPMFSRDRRLVTVFNGEIYNFQELRQQLVGRGHTFVSQSDTEVLLAAYEEDGIGCLSHLRGMFAFAIWDAATRTIVLARDRVGKKPLYYAAEGGRFAFASEIKALTSLPWLSRELDLHAIDSYFALQYIPAPRTAYLGIRKLPPGHFLVVKQDTAEPRVERYWHPEPVESRENPADTVSNLIEESIRLRLIADVEVGVLLSGGIDSSLITAVAARQSSRRVKTFSVGFRENRLNELPYAARVARLCNTDHHVIGADRVTADTLLTVLRHVDEPLADPACIPTYLIAACAAKHVKVVLSGEGADEVFGGYSYYRREQIVAPALRLAVPMRGFLDGAFARLTTTAAAQRLWKPLDRLDKVLRSVPEASVARWVSVFGPGDRRYFSEHFRRATDGVDPLMPIYRLFSEAGGDDLAVKGLAVNLRGALPDDLLMKVDKMTMACSLEARTPFLDHTLVEFMESCERRYKFTPFRSKILLKQVAARYLPVDIVSRHKHGFEVPVSTWLLNNFRDLAEDAFSTRRLRDTTVFDPVPIREEWLALAAGRPVRSIRRLWLAFCFIEWQRLQAGSN